MACRFTYKGKTYSQDELVDVLRDMSPSEAAPFIPGVTPIPDAPLIGSTDAWAGLAFKRMLRYAVDNGFDRIAWTPGDVQAERYDLSKQISRVTYTQAKVLRAYDHNNERVMSKKLNDDNEIVDHIGKEVAEKLLAQPETPQTIEGVTKVPARTLEGLDLQVGNSGMAGFYDNILPKTINKLVKKWGGKVGTTGLNVPEKTLSYEESQRRRRGESQYEPTKVWSLDITDDMREAAGKGLPLFRDTSAETLPQAPFRRGMLEQDRDRMEGALNDIAKRILGRNMKPVKLETSLPAGQWGSYNAMQELVKVSLQAELDPRTVLRHELIHVMRQHGIITKPEWSVLSRAAKAWRAEYDIDKRYRQVYGEALDLTPAQLDEILVEEAVAEAFADFWLTRSRQQGPVARIFERLARLIEAIRNWLTGNGYTSAAQIFEGMEQGGMAGRIADPAGRGFTLSRRRMAPRDLFTTEEGADGREQSVIPGAEHMTERELQQAQAQRNKKLAEMKFNSPMRSQKEQQESVGELFGDTDDPQGSLLQVMRDITKTDAFKRWFGKSKVVDAEGKPLVVYRGMTQPMAGQSFTMRDGGTYGEGIYLTTKPDDASFWANPEGTGETPTVYPVYVSIRNPAPEAIAEQVEAETTADRQSSISALEAMGYDGIVTSDGEIVAFSPAQIKSVFNAGEFDPDNPAILAMAQRQQRLRTSQRIEAGVRRAVAKVSGSTLTVRDNLIRDFADRMLWWNRLRKEFEANGMALVESQDVYLHDTLYAGRMAARIDRLEDERIRPLLKKISSSNVTSEMVDEFGYARHVHFDNVNEVIKQRNPKIGDAGSGMTDAEAIEILQRYEAKGKYDALMDIMADIDRINEERSRGELRDGLISQAEYDARHGPDAVYKHYVPLKGWHVDPDAPIDATPPRIGKRYDIRGPESMKRMGRTSKADSPLAYTMIAAHHAIIRGEKNRVGKTALRFVTANPDPSAYEVNRRVAERFAKDNSKAQMLDPSAPDWVVQERWVVEKDAPDVFSVKVGGVPAYIKFHDVSLARALKGMDAPQLGLLLRTSANAVRLLSMLTTSYNPEFWISNFPKDLQTGMFNLYSTDLRKSKVKVAAGVFKAGGGIARMLWGSKTGYWTNLAQEAKDGGAFTGWRHAQDIDVQKRQLDSLMRQAKEGKLSPKKFGRWFVNFISGVNDVIENAIRLSAYHHARQAGLSKNKAAAIAKELTVNFNRQGEKGPQIKAAWMFINPSIQGTMRLIETARTKGAGGRGARQMLGFMFMAGMAISFWNAWSGSDDEDEDGKNDWYQVPEWQKESNFVIMLQGSEYKIPLGWGLNVFPYAGQQVANLIMAKSGIAPNPEITFGGAGMNIGRAVLNSFNPWGGASLERGLAPTLLQPYFDINVTGKDWAGRNVMPNGGDWDRRPDSQKYYRSVSPYALYIAQKTNELTGGNEIKPGIIDVSPETLDYLADFAAGGAGRFVNKVGTVAAKVVTGEADTIESWQYPFLGRVYSKPSHFRISEAYYELAQQTDLVKRQLQLAIETGNTALEDEMRSKPEASVIDAVKDASNTLRQIRKRIREIDADKNMTDKAKQAEIKRLRTIGNDVHLRVVQKYNKAAGIK